MYYLLYKELPGIIHNTFPGALDDWKLTLTMSHDIWKACNDVTCWYGAGAGNTGLTCAASRCCCDEPDIVEPAACYLNLRHIRLARDGNDGLKLGAADSAHRVHRFNILKDFRRRTSALKPKDEEKKKKKRRSCESHAFMLFLLFHGGTRAPVGAARAFILPALSFGWWPLWREIPAWTAALPGSAGPAPHWQGALQISEKH